MDVRIKEKASERARASARQEVEAEEELKRKKLGAAFLSEFSHTMRDIKKECLELDRRQLVKIDDERLARRHVEGVEAFERQSIKTDMQQSMRVLQQEKVRDEEDRFRSDVVTREQKEFKDLSDSLNLLREEYVSKNRILREIMEDMLTLKEDMDFEAKQAPKQSTEVEQPEQLSWSTRVKNFFSWLCECFRLWRTT